MFGPAGTKQLALDLTSDEPVCSCRDRVTETTGADDVVVNAAGGDIGSRPGSVCQPA